MKSSAYIVNAGRGGLIEDADLIAALEAGKISGAALDVFTTEPLAEDSPYWELPNVLVTPHRAGYFLGYGAAIAQIAVANLNHYRSISEEHTSEFQSLMRTSYAVFSLKNITI